MGKYCDDKIKIKHRREINIVVLYLYILIFIRNNNRNFWVCGDLDHTTKIKLFYSIRSFCKLFPRINKFPA